MKTFDSSENTNITATQFMLDGTRYKFKYPKLGKLINVAATEGGEIVQMRALFDWFYAGLRGEGAEKIKARLADEDDTLDETQVLEIINWLLGLMGKGEPAES